MEKFKHITTHCALACLKLKFEPEYYKGQISLMRNAVNDSFSSAETKKLWLQSSTFVLSVKVNTFEGADSQVTSYCITVLLLTMAWISDSRETTIPCAQWISFIYLINLSLHSFSGPCVCGEG